MADVRIVALLVILIWFYQTASTLFATVQPFSSRTLNLGDTSQTPKTLAMATIYTLEQHASVCPTLSTFMQQLRCTLHRPRSSAGFFIEGPLIEGPLIEGLLIGGLLIDGPFVLQQKA